MPSLMPEAREGAPPCGGGGRRRERKSQEHGGHRCCPRAPEQFCYEPVVFSFLLRRWRNGQTRRHHETTQRVLQTALPAPPGGRKPRLISEPREGAGPHARSGLGAGGRSRAGLRTPGRCSFRLSVLGAEGW